MREVSHLCRVGIDVLGLVAAALTLSGFVPQILKSYTTKKMEDISYFFMILFMIGFSLWLVYGLYKNDWVIIAANVVGIIFNSVLLAMKYKYSRR